MYASVRSGSFRGGLTFLVFVSSCLFVLGCENNGVMELELNLPPAPEAFDVGPCLAGSCTEEGASCGGERCIYRGRWYSQVEISTFEFVDASGGPLQWNLTLAGVEAIPLAASGEDSRWSCTSVVGDPSVETLRVRLRYCRTINCGESLVPDLEHWFEIEQPFYAGHRTYVRRVAPVIQPSPARCLEDTECATSDGGPVCLVGRGTCGCSSDAQCPGGHCEGLNPPDGVEGRCTIDVGRCSVLGCIGTMNPLDSTDVCSTLPGETVPSVHPCEGSMPSRVEYTRPGGAGCFGVSM